MRRGKHILRDFEGDKRPRRQWMNWSVGRLIVCNWKLTDWLTDWRVLPDTISSHNRTAILLLIARRAKWSSDGALPIKQVEAARAIKFKLVSIETACKWQFAWHLQTFSSQRTFLPFKCNFYFPWMILWQNSLFLSLSISFSLLCLKKTRRKEFFPIGIECVSKIHNVVLEHGQFNWIVQTASCLLYFLCCTVLFL